MSAHTITPPPPWGTLFTTLTSVNRSPTQSQAYCLPSTRYSWNRDSSIMSTLLQRASGHRRRAFAHWSQLRHRTAIRSRPWWGPQARRWASLSWFLTKTDCANLQFHQLSGWQVLQVKKSDVAVLGWHGYTWSAVVRLVGHTENSLKWLRRRLMVQK